MTDTVSKDTFVVQALAHKYTANELVRLHDVADPQLKPLVLTELKGRSNVVQAVADEKGSSFIVQLRSPGAPFFGFGEAGKISAAINAQMTGKDVYQSVELGVIPVRAGQREADQDRAEGKTVYGLTVDHDKIAKQVMLAKSVAVLAPELNDVVAEAARGHVRHLLNVLEPQTPGKDERIAAKLQPNDSDEGYGFKSAPKFVPGKDEHPTVLDYQRRVTQVEVAEQVAIRYAALPQLHTNPKLAKAYTGLVTKTAALGALLQLKPTEEFRNVVDNLGALTTYTAPAKVAEPPRSWKSDRAGLLAALSQAREEVVGGKAQSANVLSKAAQAEPFAAVVVDSLAKIADGNAQHGLKLTPRDGAVVKLAVGTAVQLLAATPEAPSLDKLAAVVGRYDAAQQQNFVNTLVTQKVPMPRVSTLIKGFTPGG